MTKLAQQIEALRTRMADTHGDEITLVTRLAAEIAERDAEMMREVEAILLAHEQRRSDILRALTNLAARIGHVPVAGFQHVTVAMPAGASPDAICCRSGASPDAICCRSGASPDAARAFTHGQASAEVH